MDLSDPSADVDLTAPTGDQSSDLAPQDYNNVSGSVFPDVDTAVAEISTSLVTGEVELEAFIVDTDETFDGEERRVANCC